MTPFGDGSARFLKDSIDATIWGGHDSSQNGDVLSADSY